MQRAHAGDRNAHAERTHHTARPFFAQAPWLLAAGFLTLSMGCAAHVGNGDEGSGDATALETGGDTITPPPDAVCMPTTRREMRTITAAHCQSGSMDRAAPAPPPDAGSQSDVGAGLVPPADASSFDVGARADIQQPHDVQPPPDGSGEFIIPDAALPPPESGVTPDSGPPPVDPNSCQLDCDRLCAGFNGGVPGAVPFCNRLTNNVAECVVNVTCP